MPGNSVIENSLLQIFADVLAGVQLPRPKPPSTPLEHFTRTRYSEVIAPEIVKLWTKHPKNARSRARAVQDPPPFFREKVAKDLFDALPNAKINEIKGEIEQEYNDSKGRYIRNIQEMYPRLDPQETAQEMSNILLPIFSAVGALTNMNLMLWTGGRVERGFSLINITSGLGEPEIPLLIPESQKASFERAARDWMVSRQSTFLNECVNNVPVTTFHLPPHSSVNDLTLAQDSGPSLACPPLGGRYESSIVRVGNVESRASSGHQAPMADGPRDVGPSKRKLDLSSLASTSSKRLRPSFDIRPISGQPLRRSTRALGPSKTSAGGGRLMTPLSSLPSTQNIKLLRKKTVLPGRDVSLPPIRAHLEPGDSKIIVPGSAASGPKRSRLSKRALPPHIQALVDLIPDSKPWFPRALSSILTTDIGPVYERLVELLIRLELLYMSINEPTRMLAYSTDRPEQVHRWISAGRGRQGRKIEILNLNAYSRSWWAWWAHCQPGWRRFDNAGKPVPSALPVVDKDWRCLIVPGVNGLLSVVASIFWWGRAVQPLKDNEKERHVEEWNRAIQDCIWVMGCLLEVMKRKAANLTDSVGQRAGSEPEEQEIDELEDD